MKQEKSIHEKTLGRVLFSDSEKPNTFRDLSSPRLLLINVQNDKRKSSRKQTFAVAVVVHSILIGCTHR